MSQTFRRIAITGASGYLGRLLVHRLARCEGVERVLAIDIRPPREELPPNVVFAQHDVKEEIIDLYVEHEIEAVAHLAFVTQPERSIERAREVNIGGAANVLDACAGAGVRHILYMSSATVYGARADNPTLLMEDAPLRPVGGFQYAEAKVAVEKMLLEFAASHTDMSVCILRACPILGADADNFVARNLDRRVLVAVSGYDPQMQFLHESDAGEIMAHCLRNGVRGTYNLGPRDSMSWTDVAQISGCRLIRLPARLLYGLTDLTWKLGLQSNSSACGIDLIRYPWVISSGKLERELGWKPRYTSHDAWKAFASRGNSNGDA